MMYYVFLYISCYIYRGNLDFFLDSACTGPKVIDFPRYNMKCRAENVILRRIVHVGSGFPLHFMLYLGNLVCFSNRVHCTKVSTFCDIT